MTRFLFLAAFPARAQDLPPAVVYQELLDALGIDDEEGRLQLAGFVIAFPEGDRAKAVLRDGEGDLIWSRDFEGQNDGARTALRFRTASESSGGGLGRRLKRVPGLGGGSGEAPVFDASGDYTLEVEHGGEVITRLPFHVERIEFADPYADAPPRYALLGPWQTHGIVDYESGDRGREPFLQWSFYDQLLDPEREQLDFEQVRWELRRDGRLLARTVSSGQSIGVRTFHTQKFQLVERAGAGSYTDTMISRADMTDGTYELRRLVKADAYNGGDFTQTVTFEVRGGAFVPVGAQVREGTPPRLSSRASIARFSIRSPRPAKPMTFLALALLTALGLAPVDTTALSTVPGPTSPATDAYTGLYACSVSHGQYIFWLGERYGSRQYQRLELLSADDYPFGTEVRNKGGDTYQVRNGAISSLSSSMAFQEQTLYYDDAACVRAQTFAELLSAFDLDPAELVQEVVDIEGTAPAEVEARLNDADFAHAAFGYAYDNRDYTLAQIAAGATLE